ncbi:hypothetical protein DFJ73DRAFT_792447 [Zopfochytrium polystomum]|nr:hypothetical protein DFJ73DRAFT_792447 [Zopfochytrium polystomum]
MKVLIVGGGIAGPTVALALKRSGHDVELFDRELDNLDVGAGLTIKENGLRVLRRLGLLPAVLAHGIPCDRFEMANLAGSELYARYPVSNRDGLVTVNILRSTLCRILAEALAAEGVRRATTRGWASRRTFATAPSPPADILIGADGVHSSVRSILFPDLPARARPVPAGIVGYLGVSDYDPCVEWPSRGLHYFSDNAAGRCAMLMPVAASEIHWALYETKPGDSSDIALDRWQPFYNLAAERARLCGLADRWAVPAAFAPLIVAAKRIIPLSVHDLDPLPRWHLRNCVLVGDAKQALLPFIGQGSNVALEDADVLAALIDRVPHDPQHRGRMQYAGSPVASKIGHVAMRFFAMVASLTGGNLNSEEILAYDGHEVVERMMRRKDVADKLGVVSAAIRRMSEKSKKKKNKKKGQVAEESVGA